MKARMPRHCLPGSIIRSMIAILVFVLSAFVPPPEVGAGECVVFAPLGGAATVVGGEECSRRTLPASTFKVPHALIGLQAGVITAQTVYKWDGKKRDYPVWERDQ